MGKENGLSQRRIVMARIIDEFCGQMNGYSRSITLRNRLVPIGKTEENLKQFLEKDLERATAYPDIKNLIDAIHRNVIEDTLSKVALNWNEIFNTLAAYQNEKDNKKKAAIKKDLEKFQSSARKKIVDAFKKNTDFEKLFKEGLFKELLPELIKSAPVDEIADKTKALECFNRFSTYFTGFHDNRKNMYSEEAKSTAISYRIVNENFPKFFANIKLFNYLKEHFPRIIIDTEESLKDYLKGKKLDSVFSIDGFNSVLAQSGIDFYNTVIGGISGEAGTEKTQGLNEKINLARQQLSKEEKNKLRGKMVVLFKQILSDRETSSFIPVGFTNKEEVYSTVKEFNNSIAEKAVSKVRDLFLHREEFTLNEIFVPAKSMTAFSQSVFGNWSILPEGLFLLEKDVAKKQLTEKQVEALHKEIAKKDCSLAELQKAYERWCAETGVDVTKNINQYFAVVALRTKDNTFEKEEISIVEEISNTYSRINFDDVHDLQQEKEAATPIKNYLDEVQNLYHHLKLVDYHGEEQKDTHFYSKLDEILTALSEVVPLYNKVRNFVTKKPGEMKKVKLNFDNVSLAKGWDVNKESDYTCILLRKENKYFLGIFNPKDKPKFDVENQSSDIIRQDSDFEKLVYKYFKDVTTMIPKCSTQLNDVKKHFEQSDEDFILNNSNFIEPLVISKRIFDLNNETFDGKKKFQIDYFRNTKDIAGYESAVKDWISFCMTFVKCYKSTSVYDYSSLGDCSQFKQVDQFYSAINLLLYKIWFVNISEKKINSLINEGKLFLFQIYNKDFAEKKSGKKNLHTLYWENLFSEENLQDVCLKLNGEAELFWRKASLDKERVTVHKKGSILVNRTTADGKSIPEDIYQEIYQYKNKMIANISDEAKVFLDSGTVICKEATHDITKDRRFTEDTYLFHCPITMNFKAADKTNRDFNNHVLEVLKKNSDVKIIGLDRGERHLVYLSLINQKGEIELQKTLNLVDQVRNDKTVKINYQEKLVHKEGDRNKARKNWLTIGNIKELKEGYLSAIVHEIATLMVENNAIVVMEDLNFGFKRGRFAVERQIYQKFENMLIEKLNYLVFKDTKVTQPGGVLNAYQLTNKSANITDVYKQCGWLFYVPAAYTSKIDPKTGFANLFITKGLTNVEKKKEFFDKFDSIRYDSKEDCFVFGFDYGKICDNASFRKEWEVYTRGERLIYNKATHQDVSINPTEELKSIFTSFGINWNTEDTFIDAVKEIQAEKTNAKFFDTLLRMFNATLQMRNSKTNSSKEEDDYLISPVKADDGTFFDSRNEVAKGKNESGKWISYLPVDSDANGAYHIALKGLFLLKNDFNRDDKGIIQNISNKDWFKFVQDKSYTK